MFPVETISDRFLLQSVNSILEYLCGEKNIL